MTKRLSPAAGLLVAALALSAAGCGDGKKPTGNVSGTVTYNGKPLTMGSVNFLSSTGAVGMGNLDDTGHYKIDGAIESGEYTVYLNPPIPGMAGPPGSKPPPPAAKYPVAPKFQQPTTSGVKATVKAGDNTIPLEFKD